MTTHASVSFFYGVPDAAMTPPPGFAWAARPRDFLRAREVATGREYYVLHRAGSHEVVRLVRRRTATLLDWLRTLGRLRPGRSFVDYRDVITFIAE